MYVGRHNRVFLTIYDIIKRARSLIVYVNVVVCGRSIYVTGTISMPT